ncbi:MULTISPECIES: UDP-N-acetylmuramate--L-alanine ligase [Chryseobacterium]|uniref:UDP-N-acetylmuramate: L-alanyl-gamma-D-glutamyl-meso-diaminopimelate ligase n=1 Tax=Chryseobacterium camelliae TaxID=1265445 RepID=A0ABU0TJP2_9FLAO|nr:MULTISPECIES: Mur ligase family protein [Chryseobacterium]MDT3408901.1 UDP-N-acetylmuramate: L-alanyl-gamma-D-glutamyl-meso-diaminopimelate ligase [Pseudacidovorax intermedius]MDQ1097242.1 UDP-N-acetylmuramate: L-alanyl-gamma-D-glutamyl-meso-diaminopimelate ligase [Chryseobacterium camelliae]MDQ1101177.1 UDP-N-acetylmuramate: L-alanyl-gamma-D-glutamyl-meso-diaminopimelate ligase [Chryseobacterium sp. SORGH_AS_1048]MDR6084622.1 UDP-N-acetylmuramate: L-alanyl-gamma-D-glutamyl-meso-diaminopimel
MRTHFIAIGGSAMHNLAIALKDKGYQVTGSDDIIFEPSMSRLQQKGILPEEMGWFPEKITPDIDAVILGMHAHQDNPELARAKELGLKIYSYPEFLYEQSKDKTRVVIAGSHGKTTITSMILHVLNFHQKDVDFMVGAQLEGFDCMVKITKDNDFMVLEGDEYLSSPIDLRSKFLLYQPNIALMSGIAWDHINVFTTFDDYIEQFRKFVATITPGGVLVYNEEDPEVVKVVDQAENYFRKIPYHTPEYEISNGKVFLKTEIGDIPLSVFGAHNLLNMEGARLICRQLGVMDEDFYEAIMSFKGASKRLEKVERSDNGILYKDFAHAPSKVKAAVKAFTEQFKKEKTYGFLELHTYSSLNPAFLEQYDHAMDGLDEAVVFYSEDALKIKRMEPISPELIREKFKNESLKVFTRAEDLHAYWNTLDKTQGVYLMMSSGNFGGLDLTK